MKKILCVCFLLLMFAISLSACDNQTIEPTITVSEDGYVIVNGVKTEHKVHTEPTITVVDGYVAVNGVKTEYEVNTADIITIEDGYLVVNGVKTEHEVKNKNHSFSDWKLYNEDVTDCEKKLYYRTCSACSTIEWKEGQYEDHAFSTVTTPATCQAKGYDTKTCNACGKVEVCNETPIAEHDFKTSYITDNSFHWHKCSMCDTTTIKEEHICDSNNICTICKMPMGPTEGIMYYISTDGTYVEVGDYVGSSSTVMIAEEYQGLPVRVITSEAFQGKGVVAVHIPPTITEIHEDSFDYSLSAIYITDIVAWCNMDFGGRNPLYYAHNLYLNGELVENIVLPEGIERIAGQTFAGCTSLKSITIPDSVTTIEYNAFQGCTNLRNVSIPASVTSIGGNAFSGCAAVEIENGIGYVDTWVISFSGTATTLELREGTLGIAEDVFCNITKLRSVVLPDSMLYIGEGAFQSCYNLGEINIPCGVKSIGIAAFNCCDKLTSIIIPNSVTTIGAQALSCEGLSIIVLSKNVAYIEDWTFMDCPNLKTVYYLGTADELSKVQIGYSGNHYFKSAIKYYYSENQPTTEGNYWHYADGVPTPW